MKQRRFAPFTRAGSIVAGALTLATLLAGCAGGSSAASGGSSNDAGASGPVHIKVWAWYPEFKGVVDAFNASHKDIQVDWSNVGTGPDQYAKLKTAFKAGSGAPDVAMVEFQEIPSFVILDKLVDMGEYGANDDKSLYADWAWKQATDGNKVYAIPVDGGPMALMYRKDLFAKYKIAVPKTWDEYAAAATRRRTSLASARTAAGSTASCGRPAASRTATPRRRPRTPSASG
jgi:multiple sugar transport system substrate-binding protein